MCQVEYSMLHAAPDMCRLAWQQGDPLGLRLFFIFFVKDRPKGPSTANYQRSPTANRQLPPTASGDQPPPANHC